MKWTIIGTGAVGGLYGGRLVAAGCDVTFLARSDAQVLRRQGLTVRSPDGNWHGIVKVTDRREELLPADVVVLAVKAGANTSIASWLPPLVAPGGVVLCLQNGLGSEEEIAASIGTESVLAGAAFVCAERTEAGVIDHFAAGGLAVGPWWLPGNPLLVQRAEAITTAFRAAGVLCRVAEGRRIKWGKLLWNVPFSGLSIACGGITTDLVLRDHVLEARALGLEVVEAARVCGVMLDPLQVDQNIESTRSMGAYRPSILIDFLAGRPLETRWIVEEPLRRGEAAGAHLPRLRALLESMRQVAPHDLVHRVGEPG